MLCAPFSLHPAALAAACPLCFLLSHDTAPSPHVIKSELTPGGFRRRCGGDALEAGWRLLVVVMLVVLPLALPRMTAGNEGGETVLKMLNLAVLVLCLLCRGSSLLQRPYLVFTVR